MADDARVSRRRFFRIGIAGAVVLGAGGALLWLDHGYDVPPDVRAKLTTLSAKEYRIVEAIVARMMRPDAPDLPTPADVGAALRVDALVASLDEATLRDLKRLLQVVEHALPLRAGHATRFTKLSGEAQDAVLEDMQTSSVKLLRGAFESLKSLAAMSYFRDPRTWRAIDYDGPLVARPAGGWW